MRRYTLALSFAAHAAMIGCAIVVPIFATGDLPDAPSSTTFLLVTPAVPDVPPPAPRPVAVTRVANPDAAPVVEPDGVTPETVRAPVANLLVDDTAIPGAGVIPGGVVPGSEVIAPPPLPRQTGAPLRTGGDIKPPQKIRHVAPEYPAIARSARVSGVVILEAVIAEDGTVEDVHVLRSIRLLDDAAVAAVRQWRFTPTLLNGQPVRVLMTVTVAFTLN